MRRALPRALLVFGLAACGPHVAATPVHDTPPPARHGRAELAQVIERVRAAAAQGDRAGCVGELGQIDDAWLGDPEQDEQALVAAAECTHRTDRGCDYYTEALTDEPDPYCVLALKVALAPRAAYADASSPRCGFGDLDVMAGLPGDADRCVGISPGNGVDLDQLDAQGNAPPGSCPHLVLLERHGTQVTSTDLALGGRSMLDNPSNCCHATELATRRGPHGAQLLLSSGGPARDCFGGTASVDELEVWDLTDHRLAPVADLGVMMH